MSETALPNATDHSHTVSNGKTDLTFDELGGMQPGVARLMLEVSNRFSRAYHAAKAENRRLATFQLSEGVKVLRLCGVVQPRYVEPIAQFVEEHVTPLRALFAAKDWSHVDDAWDLMTKEINRWHEEFAHGFLVWRVSPNPPDDLDLTPRPEDD
jgi:hypothetical protein